MIRGSASEGEADPAQSLEGHVEQGIRPVRLRRGCLVRRSRDRRPSLVAPRPGRTCPPRQPPGPAASGRPPPDADLKSRRRRASRCRPSAAHPCAGTACGRRPLAPERGSGGRSRTMSRTTSSPPATAAPAEPRNRYRSVTHVAQSADLRVIRLHDARHGTATLFTDGPSGASDAWQARPSGPLVATAVCRCRCQTRRSGRPRHDVHCPVGVTVLLEARGLPLEIHALPRRERMEALRPDVGVVAPTTAGRLGRVEYPPPFLVVPLTDSRSHHAATIRVPAVPTYGGPRLGKLRSFVAGSGAEQGERSNVASSDWAAVPVTPRCSPLDRVRLWCRDGAASAMEFTAADESGTAGVPFIGQDGARTGHRVRDQASSLSGRSWGPTDIGQTPLRSRVLFTDVQERSRTRPPTSGARLLRLRRTISGRTRLRHRKVRGPVRRIITTTCRAYSGRVQSRTGPADDSHSITGAPVGSRHTSREVASRAQTQFGSVGSSRCRVHGRRGLHRNSLPACRGRSTSHEQCSATPTAVVLCHRSLSVCHRRLSSTSTWVRLDRTRLPGPVVWIIR